MSDEIERAYLRRVRNPDPLMLELARQACDRIENDKAFDFGSLGDVARVYGVPLAYLFDERERRVRDGRP